MKEKNKSKNLGQQRHKLVQEILGFECGGNLACFRIKVHKFIWKTCVRLVFGEGFHS